MKKLKDLKPCDYKERAEKYRTLRKHWNDASAKDLMWLIGKAHSKGSIPRKRLVGITLVATQPAYEQMPSESANCCAMLEAWCHGEEVDLAQICVDAAAADYVANTDAVAAAAADYVANTDAVAAAAARAAAYAAYAAAYAAADTPARAAAYAVRAAVDAAVYAAARSAADTACVAARAADASQKQADIIREAITFEEACSYLDLDPEEVLT